MKEKESPTPYASYEKPLIKSEFLCGEMNDPAASRRGIRKRFCGDASGGQRPQEILARNVVNRAEQSSYL